MRNQTLARLLVVFVVLMLVMSFMIGAFPVPR
jgi:hypothetical protein